MQDSRNLSATNLQCNSNAYRDSSREVGQVDALGKVATFVLIFIIIVVNRFLKELRELLPQDVLWQSDQVVSRDTGRQVGQVDVGRKSQCDGIEAALLLRGTSAAVFVNALVAAIDALEYLWEVLPEDVFWDALEIPGENAGRQVAEVHVVGDVETGAVCGLWREG